MTHAHGSRLHLDAVLTVLGLAIAAPGEAANECQVSYTYLAGSGPSAVPQVAQTQVSANAISTVNQGAMRYVVNDRDWPVEVEVTMLGGGSKWVSLTSKGKRDPAHVNYVGDIILKKVKCLPGGTAGADTGIGAGPGTVGETTATMMLMMQQLMLQRSDADAEKKRVAAHEALVTQIFASVRAVAVPFAGQLAAWTAEARAVSKRTAADFAGCPSAAAQATYDDLNGKRQYTVQARDAAQAASAQAQQALVSCQAQTGNSPSCGSAYSALTFSLHHSNAVVTLAAIDSALTTLRALRCVSPLTNRSVPLVSRP